MGVSDSDVALLFCAFDELPVAPNRATTPQNRPRPVSCCPAIVLNRTPRDTRPARWLNRF